MSTEDNNKETTPSKIEKKSKKKIIAAISSIGVFIPIIIALLYITNPQPTQEISVGDFPIEKFSQGYDILCNKYPDQSLSCLVKNDGRVTLSLVNGIYKFQTIDFSLMKGFISDVGDEEKSISYAFYADGSSVKIIDESNYSMWLVIPQI